MNRYPLWKNLLIGLVLVWGLIYTLPNLYGEVPAVQVSSAKATLKLDPGTVSERMAGALKEAGIEHEGIFADLNTVRAAFSAPTSNCAPRTPSSAPSIPTPRTRPTSLP